MASQDVVGPGWLQLGVSNYPFVDRTDEWVHRPTFWMMPACRGGS